ncbi:hypothetical protein CGRA01v4_07550 [Colletotrichum graminicola]|nr:hypothetical protein CGRA01v4_07550 [Colletotrichum graminicola]
MRSRPDRLSTHPSPYTPATAWPRRIFGRPSTSFCANAYHTLSLDLLVFPGGRRVPDRPSWDSFVIAFVSDRPFLSSLYQVEYGLDTKRSTK